MLFGIVLAYLLSQRKCCRCFFSFFAYFTFFFKLYDIPFKKYSFALCQTTSYMHILFIEIESYLHHKGTVDKNWKRCNFFEGKKMCLFSHIYISTFLETFETVEKYSIAQHCCGNYSKWNKLGSPVSFFFIWYSIL